MGDLDADAWVVLTKRWAFLAAQDGSAPTDLWRIDKTPQHVAVLAGEHLDGNDRTFAEHDLDATESWVFVRRPDGAGQALYLWHLTNPPVATKIGPLPDWSAASFSGSHAVSVDERAWTTVWDPGVQTMGPRLPPPQWQYVSNLTLARNGKWGLFEHGSADDRVSPRPVLVTAARVADPPAPLPDNPWQVACGIVKTPLSPQRWREIAPDAQFREICRSPTF